MDTLSSGVALNRLPGHVRDELTDVDRLRSIWARHRQGQPRDARAAARRALIRRRVLDLGGAPALEDLVVSTSEEGMSGQAVSVDYVRELARRAADLPTDCASRSPARPLKDEEARRLADAAALPAHPVVRAAYTFAECVAVLRGLDCAQDGSDRGAGAAAPTTAGTGEDPPWALPWILASLVLQRSDYPPLPPGPGASPPPSDGREPGDRLPALVHYFARLVTGTLRDELCWAPASVPPPRVHIPPLASVTCRRIQEYVRSRRASLGLILQALDPEARTVVRSGGFDDTREESSDTAPVPASRTVLTPGAAHWWTALDLVVGEASLTLFVVVQEVGRPHTGVLAVTADARLTTPDGVRDALDISGADSVTVMPTDCVDDRWPQVRDLVDEAVSRAMNALTQV
ncbi:hypothetical protein [Nocardiopsis lucentensis]|uniref:hypothetical protein n=1 Tax=Nocardiopsis lucentensis TaxID=53441 RepID=UPI001267FEE9|nr:hypothetical protein [Nocardiopsis lucentensis]